MRRGGDWAGCEAAARAADPRRVTRHVASPDPATSNTAPAAHSQGDARAVNDAGAADIFRSIAAPPPRDGRGRKGCA